MNKVKTLSDLETYDDVQQAKSDFDKTDKAIKSVKSRISKLRKSLAGAERTYNDSLSSDDVPYEELEGVQEQIDEYRQSLKDEGETLKQLEGELPAKKQALDKANQAFLKEARPVIDGASKQAVEAWKQVQAANDHLIQIRKQTTGTPLSASELPGFDSDRFKNLDDKFRYVFSGRWSNE